MRRSALLGVLCCALTSCSGGSGDKSDGGSDGSTAIGTPQGERVSVTIGSDGGSLTSADDRLEVRIPPGALTSPTVISVQAIGNEAHGGVGSAYRIDAGGATLAAPASLVFTYDDEDVKGSAPEQLKLAFQREDRRWQLAGTPSLDTAAKTVTVETTHFSDWSPIRGRVLKPTQATVKTGETVRFEVMSCEQTASQADGPVAPLVVPCSVLGLLEEVTWSVNGVVGGNATIGTVGGGAGGFAIYTAPSEVPEPDEVAVSVRYGKSGGGAEILVAPVRVTGARLEISAFPVYVTDIPATSTEKTVHGLVQIRRDFQPVTNATVTINGVQVPHWEDGLYDLAAVELSAGPGSTITIAASIGANEPRTLTFQCPELVEFTSPAPDSVIAGEGNLAVSWSRGIPYDAPRIAGGPMVGEYACYSSSGGISGLGHGADFVSLAVGQTSATISMSDCARYLVELQYPGETVEVFEDGALDIGLCSLRHRMWLHAP